MDKRFMILNLDSILPNRFQPRLKFDDYKLSDLADSIQKFGVIEPIVVRQINDKYEIIAGERRYKASVLAGKKDIPAIVVNLSDKDSEEIALLENVQRQNLSPIEEAVSYKRIINMGYITRDELAKKLGKSPLEIAQKLKLLELDDEVQDALLQNEISERHARSLGRIKDPNEQVKMLHRVIKERLTVKALDKEINDLLTKPKKNDQEVESLFGNTNNQKIDYNKLINESENINKPKEKAPMKDLLMKEDKKTMNNNFNGFNNFNQQPTQNNQNIFNQEPNNYQNNTFNQEPNYQNNQMNGINQNVSTVNSSTQHPEYHVLGENKPLNENPNINNLDHNGKPSNPAIPDDNIINENRNNFTNQGFNPNMNQNVSNMNNQNIVNNPYNISGNNPSIPSQNSIPEGNQSIPNMPNIPNNMYNNIQNEPNYINQNAQVNENNFNDAINLIKQCAEQVEKLGYNVDLKGMPMGNNYQLIFDLKRQN